jgi:hypothetical protein
MSDLKYDPAITEDCKASSISIRLTFAAKELRLHKTVQIHALLRGIESVQAALCEIYDSLPENEEGYAQLIFSGENPSERLIYTDEEENEDMWLGDFLIAYEIFDIVEIDPRMFPDSSQDEDEQTGNGPDKSKFH